jgi:hypothetical protein
LMLIARNTQCASRGDLRRTDSARNTSNRPPARTRFPERKIGDGFLGVFVALDDTFAGCRISSKFKFQTAGRNGSRSRDIFQWRNRPSRPARLVGDAARDELFDERNDFGNVPGRARALDAAFFAVERFQGPPKNAASNLPVNSRQRGFAVSRTRLMILSSMSVIFITCVTWKAVEFQDNAGLGRRRRTCASCRCARSHKRSARSNTSRLFYRPDRAA